MIVIVTVILTSTLVTVIVSNAVTVFVAVVTVIVSNAVTVCDSCDSDREQ